MALPDNGFWRIATASNRLNLQVLAFASSFRQALPRVLQGNFGVWEIAACGSLPFIFLWILGRRRRTNKAILQISTDESTDGSTAEQNRLKDTDITGEWQLQYLSDAGKWDVKNLAKWQAVKPVSEPINKSMFRAMKTLREVDDSHSPEIFVKEWGSQITDIIDISHDNPAYDPRGLEKGGIRYHKFPTVSKIPPTDSEVKGFIALVDRIRSEQSRPGFVAVHCHYGFNRTGFFIVCYLKERCGYTVPAAVLEFAEKRPKGIKHAHFLDTLYVRYCEGLKRAPTL